MSNLIEDKDRLVQYCRDSSKQALVIKAIINNGELKKYIRSIVSRKESSSYQTVMNDTIISFIRSCMKPEFELEKRPLSYIKRIAKNIWLMNVRKENGAISTYQLTHDESTQIEQLYTIQKERKQLVTELLSRITTECKDILLLWAKTFKMKEIAAKLNYSTEKYVKKKKHLCLKKLVAIVNKNPKLKSELKQYV